MLQWADNGTNDHLWEFYLLSDGNYLIKNATAAYYLEDANSRHNRICHHRPGRASHKRDGMHLSGMEADLDE